MTTATTLRPVEPEVRRKLTKLAKAATSKTRERDKLIAEAFLGGASMRDIARAVSMSHPGVRNILIRDGVYDPVLDNPMADRVTKAAARQRLARDYEGPK